MGGSNSRGFEDSHRKTGGHWKDVVLSTTKESGVVGVARVHYYVERRRRTMWGLTLDDPVGPPTPPRSFLEGGRTPGLKGDKGLDMKVAAIARPLI